MNDYQRYLLARELVGPECSVQRRHWAYELQRRACGGDACAIMQFQNMLMMDLIVDGKISMDEVLP